MQLDRKGTDRRNMHYWYLGTTVVWVKTRHRVYNILILLILSVLRSMFAIVITEIQGRRRIWLCGTEKGSRTINLIWELEPLICIYVEMGKTVGDSSLKF